MQRISNHHFSFLKFVISLSPDDAATGRRLHSGRYSFIEYIWLQTLVTAVIAAEERGCQDTASFDTT